MLGNRELPKRAFYRKQIYLKQIRSVSEEKLLNAHQLGNIGVLFLLVIFPNNKLCSFWRLLVKISVFFHLLLIQRKYNLVNSACCDKV